jgi:EAL domain-containing protein (putative c-di-GMP-specific phosphodiesterase class I)/predicted Ser/Thr protein kinase
MSNSVQMALENLRILIVDNDNFQREAISQALATVGATGVRAVDNPFKALLLVAGEPIDVILYGVEQSEPETLDFMKSLGQSGEACSLILTGPLGQAAAASIATIARKSGLRLLGALEKPFSAPLLLELLERHGSELATPPVLITRMTAEDVAQGLDRDEFRLHYQPRVALHNGVLEGCEALLRWEHPELGLLLPSAFMRSLQQVEAIDRMAMVVLEKGLHDLQGWVQAGLSLPLSINISAIFLSQRGAANQIIGVVSDFEEITSSMLTFEITEEALIEPVDQLLSNLTRLRAKGFGLAVDNYSAFVSEEQLARLPLTEMKLSSNLLIGAASSTKSRASKKLTHSPLGLTEAIQLSQRLNLNIVADGVERGEEWDLLASLGCKMAQGHLIARPLEAAAYLEWAQKHSADSVIMGSPAQVTRFQNSRTVLTPSQITTGSLLGHYKLENLLGQGGFGKVFQAVDTRLLRPVAVKVLLDSKLDKPNLERFVQEARALARVQHPGVVTIHEIGLQPCHYIVMELLDGIELEKILKRTGPLAPDQARDVAIQILEALQAVHAKGILHRDLKPSNVMVNEQGRARIMDFGIAKIVDEERRLTQTGQFCGTPQYMAPEQIDISLDGVDERTDLFAVGTIFYEILTGEYTVKAVAIHQILTQLLLTVPRPPHEVKSDVPRILSDICMRALEKNKADRYAGAADFLAALRAAEF